MSPKSMAKSSRGKGWTDPEVQMMLDAVEVHVPWGPAHWENVAETYNSTIPTNQGWPARDVDSIRRKFKALRSVRKPTGDPLCPPSVSRAKRLQQAIEAAMGVFDLQARVPNGHDDEDTASCSDGANDTPDVAVDSPVATDAVATQRTDLTPAQLIALGQTRGSEPAISQTAARRRKIDDMLSTLAENQVEKRQRMESGVNGTTLMEFIMRMEERDAAFRAQQLEAQERREKFDQCMLAVFAKLLEK
ncbi:hypothetical protein AaE_015859 [Aphanomyces astaci]|uniref:DUF6818 domain-containing protein n=1 Tax=Aphanomyces astaci TaxID=112090 RepID=A0A6A4YY96_APHAT|nr:hypothetical protein AaE_015859 [Aphanomyces astaci]